MAESVVVWDAAAFGKAYPQLAPDMAEGVTAAQLEQAFNVACLMLDNTAASPVPYDPEHGVETRRVLLWLLVCHLATLAMWGVGQSGPLASSSQGSVSASFAVPRKAGREWYALTPCGLTYWTAVQRYVVGGRYHAASRSCRRSGLWG